MNNVGIDSTLVEVCGVRGGVKKHSEIKDRKENSTIQPEKRYIHVIKIQVTLKITPHVLNRIMWLSG